MVEGDLQSVLELLDVRPAVCVAEQAGEMLDGVGVVLCSVVGGIVDEFLHVLEESFSHDEVWPQPYDHLYVSLRSGRSVGKELDADELAEPALQFDTEPAVEPEDLEQLPSSATTAEPEDLRLDPAPSDEIMAENSHQPDMHLDEAGNEPDTSTDTDDLPNVSIDRPLRVTFGNELRYAPTMAELIRCRRHRGGTLQSVPLPKVGSNTPYPSSLKGTHRRVHRHYQCKDLTRQLCGRQPIERTHGRSTSTKSRFEALRHDTSFEMPSCPSMMANSSICRRWANVCLFPERWLRRLWLCITSRSSMATQESFEPWP